MKNSRPDLESALKTDSEMWVYILDEKKKFIFDILDQNFYFYSTIKSLPIKHLTNSNS